MHELTYRSKAREEMTLKEIQNILDVAAIENRKFNISGCLIYHRGTFIQIIEGDRKDVLALYSKINNDIRHSCVELLWEGASEKRYFPDWEMAFYSTDIGASEADIREFEQNLSLFSEFCDKPSAATILFWRNVNELLQNYRYNRTRTI